MQLFESPDETFSQSYLWGWKNSEVNKKKVGHRGRIFHKRVGCYCLRKRRTPRDLNTRVEKCVEVEGEIFENLL
jgi:hypothetical protein